ncbi:hypothetical protein TG4357_01269 [Thalassovita gelatinovora]|uniref:Uncharacterized protein n=1 Tax=Thalassovita gelatinovora TaxID=53501 RepID=A0A0P1F8Q5_THAGE|nr:hypothetical protein [Thalassovita gelatinovora]CUH64424.1 hypothetical protein TG4357_01269 [Thalassovita gelatinovora]SEP99017.1 hypothetical protein SAMN04488043_102408 [Thalassovita gelatinovora]
MGELGYAAIFCLLIANGQTEAEHGFSAGYDLHKIRIDCETEDSVIEVGLDKRSSLDSIQQALFAAYLTGKKPVVMIVDTDGRTGAYETRIEAAAKMAGVEFLSYHAQFLVRWQMTSWLRSYLHSKGPDS